ncbi:T9SS type A sorting domain-containing protein, partial [candidate division WOR-3 bacterium]|nr:T9SS type A sorting domain-containing protein [candidate division WOR-3 bacterium]
MRRMIFIILLFLLPGLAFADWQINMIVEYPGGSFILGGALGDGNNGGINKLYAACHNGYIYQYTWNDTSWEETTLDGSGPGWMMDATVGDGNSDDTLEVYGSNYATFNYHTYQYIWNGTSWDRTDLGEGGAICVYVGDGDNDTNLEIYAVKWDSLVYRYEWNGTSWDESNLGETRPGTSMMNVLVGDGDNDGENEVYAGSPLCQFKWNGASWEYNVIDSVIYIDKVSLALGDGNNDGENELYATSAEDTTLYQYKWNGTSWDKTPLFSIYGMRCAAVGDGNNDGENEVYTGIYQGHVTQLGRMYELKWNGSSWDLTDMGQAYSSCVNEILVGDGDNDGNLEVYGNLSRGIYQYIFQSTPILSWTGDPGFESDGVDPDSGIPGDTFEFRVCYTDSNDYAPIIKELQVDLDDNGTYEAWEKFSMVEMDTTDTIFTDGKNYTKSITVDHAGDGILNYRFTFKNFYNYAIGEPTGEHSFIVLPSGITENQITAGDFLIHISPNPFKEMTEIRWQITDSRLQITDDRPQLKIYDAAGRLVKNFILYPSSFILPAKLEWDGSDDEGRKVTPGIYFARLSSGKNSHIKKI